MPIYEFRCGGCNEVFELLALSQGEEMEAKCPQCGGYNLNRIMSSSNAVIGGSSNGQTGSGPTVQNRSCKDCGDCTTLTLPGHTR